ncbi:MAG: transposase [Dehalococcoidia bacterium]|nr:transposase [Dehalococcoidia bacterium]
MSLAPFGQEAACLQRRPFPPGTKGPPRSPAGSIPGRPGLREWKRTYNHLRPHQALGQLTPAGFLARRFNITTPRGSVSNVVNQHTPLPVRLRHPKMHRREASRGAPPRRPIAPARS